MASAAAPVSTLKGRARETLLRMVKSIQSVGSRWKVLVVDAKAVRVISAACRMYDITEEGITLVEALEKQRQPFPSLDAIYMITPTEDSIQRVIADFADNRDLYAGAHIFFTSYCPESLLQKFNGTAAILRVATLQELNLEFIAWESETFHLDSPLNKLVPPVGDAHVIAAQLATVFATVGDFPFIRHAGTDITRAVAVALDDRFRKMPQPGGSRARGTLLILDRTIDLIAPAIHEFTYQAMLYDLLESDISKDCYSYQYVGPDETEREKSVLLGEQDPLWVAFRHKSVASTAETLQEDFRQFMQANKAVSQHIQGKSAEGISFKQMSELMAATPKFQELKNKYATHIHLHSAVKKLYSHNGLEAIGTVEQDMATGVNRDGDTVKNLVGALVPVLSSPTTKSEDRLRLMLIFAATQNTRASDLKTMMDKAGLGSDHRMAVEMINKLAEQSGFRQSQNKKKKKAKATGELQVLESRFVPRVKDLLEDMVADTLSADFPYEGDSPSSTNASASTSAAAAAAPEAKSVKRNKKKEATWADKGKGTKTEGEGLAAPTSGARLYVYVIGGLSLNESRSAYEVMKKHNREVIIGGCNILTPGKFIKALQ